MTAGSTSATPHVGVLHGATRTTNQPTEEAMTTFGDALDRALGGPEHFVSDHCRNDRHGVCLGDYGGRTCECDCLHPLARRDRPRVEEEWQAEWHSGVDDELAEFDRNDEMHDRFPHAALQNAEADAQVER